MMGCRTFKIENIEDDVGDDNGNDHIMTIMLL